MSEKISELKIVEIAKVFGVHRNTIPKWHKEGKLKGYDLDSVVQLVREIEQEKVKDLLINERKRICNLILDNVKKSLVKVE